MNRVRVTASSKDAALRAAMRAANQEHLIAPATAADEHEAELAQGPEAALGDDPLGKVQGEDFTADDVMVEERPEGEGEEKASRPSAQNKIGRAACRERG